MRKSSFFIFNVVMFAILLEFCGMTNAQTGGTMTFSVNLTSHSSTYGLDHLVAIWVQNAGNTFVKTKYKMSGTSDANSHLAIWKNSSGGNVVDATSGASLHSYVPISVSWNATDVSSSVVTDGIYRVLVEFAWGSSTGIPTGKDTMSVTFNKSTGTVHLTPANRTNFTSIVLDWAPLGTAVNEQESTEGINISPNPSNGIVNIDFTKELQACDINVFDEAGNHVYNEHLSGPVSGNRTIDLSKCASGIYYIHIIKDSQIKMYQQKLLITK